jgi:hypothetical protein
VVSFEFISYFLLSLKKYTWMQECSKRKRTSVRMKVDKRQLFKLRWVIRLVGYLTQKMIVLLNECVCMWIKNHAQSEIWKIIKFHHSILKNVNWTKLVFIKKGFKDKVVILWVILWGECWLLRKLCFCGV